MDGGGVGELGPDVERAVAGRPAADDADGPGAGDGAAADPQAAAVAGGERLGRVEPDAEAADVVAHAMPRVVLLDLTMPVMDGFAFLHALRERPGCRDLPVIVLSARDLSNAERTRLKEANQVLQKGATSLQDLAKDVRALADSK